MSFNFTEYKQLVKGYERIAKELDNWLIQFLEKQANWLIGQAKERTPVDTGNLRRNWRITKVNKLPNGDLEFSLINDADYSSYVELGHTTKNREKWVEGYYMATISMSKLQQYMPRRFDREFKIFLAQKGVL